MPIITRCPECGTKYRLDQKHLGRRARCKNGHMFTVIPEAQVVGDPEPVIPEATASDSVPRPLEKVPAQPRSASPEDIGPATPQQAKTPFLARALGIALGIIVLRLILRVSGC